MRRLTALFVALWLSYPLAASSQATGPAQARYGARLGGVGASAGPIWASGRAGRGAAAGWAAMAHLGFHHFVHPRVMMSAELGAGGAHLGPSSVAPAGDGERGLALAYQVGLRGAWFVARDLEGPYLGAGAQLFGAQLKPAAILQLGGDLRLGWAWWTRGPASRFLAVELSASLPLVQGFRLPETFDGSAPRARTDWFLRRLVFQWSASL